VRLLISRAACKEELSARLHSRRSTPQRRKNCGGILAAAATARDISSFYAGRCRPIFSINLRHVSGLPPYLPLSRANARDLVAADLWP